MMNFTGTYQRLFAILLETNFLYKVINIVKIMVAGDRVQNVSGQSDTVLSSSAAGVTPPGCRCAGEIGIPRSGTPPQCPTHVPLSRTRMPQEPRRICSSG